MSIDIWRIVTLVLACTVVLRPHAYGGRWEGLAGPLGDEGPLPLPEPELVVRDPGLAAGDMPTRLRTALAYREEARAACASGEMARLVEAAEHSEDLLAVARDYDEHPAVRILAVESLSFLAPLFDGVDWFASDTADPKAPWPENPIWEASHAVLELGEPAAALFAETLASDKGRKLRRQAAWYLGRLGIANEEIAGALLEALGDADAIVAADAAMALGNVARRAGKLGVSVEKAVNQLVEAAKARPKSDIPIRALQAIGDIAEPTDDAVCMAREHLSGQGQTAVAAAYALARCAPDSPDGLDRLIELVGSEYFQPSLSALIALGRLGPPAGRAVSAIEADFDTRDVDWVERLKEEVLSRIRAGATTRPGEPEI